ncbi:sensor histidine kinase [Kocuria coralli]|uniref:sensor histidine kinase n=1 Tax=Kocuria coralli TaxID=1461025 RepID=UPI001C703EA1|nr:HAMP domain-containing sensor histidine kinase [Kocuria coralli]
MTGRVPFHRTLAFRSVAGVVLLLAAVLAAAGTFILVQAQRTLDTQLDDAVHQAMARSAAFTGGDEAPGGQPAPSPAASASPGDLDRDPLETPGQPVGVLSVDVVDGAVHKATYLNAQGTAEQLPAEDVDALMGLGLTDGSEAVAPPEADQADLVGVDLSLGHYRVGAVGPIGDGDPGSGDAGQGSTGQDGTGQQAGAQRFVVTGLPSEQVTHTQDVLVTTVLGGSAAALVVTGLLGLWWVRYSLRPLAEVSRSAAQVAALPMETGEAPVRDYRVRGDLARPGTEIGDVGHALNLLLANVDDALQRRNASESQLRQFVADASHELRTPLASVRGYADMIRLSEQLSPQGRVSLERLLAQAYRMGGLVDDLLLLARLDAGRSPESAPVDLGEIVAEAVMDATAAGPEHRWDLRVPDEPVLVSGDSAQLAQLVGNLLSNARKHTPRGTEVQAELTVEHGEAVLHVDDDGPGIPARFHEHLFDRFARGDPARAVAAPAEESTGLGLAIVRTVAEAHGGSATVDSPRMDLGTGRSHGTRFTVRLPLADRGD